MKPPWPTKKLGEVAYFQEGPGLRTFQFKPNGIRVINVANIQNGFLDLTETKFLDPDEVKQKYKHFLVNENDILVSTSGTIGRVAWVKKQNLPLMLNTSVVRFHTLNEKILSNKFLFYFLSSSLFKNEILKYKTGVAIFNVGPSHIKRIKIPLPPIKIQQKIVERLDAIKKAQELNYKQIELSEELFQSLLHRELDQKGKNWEVKKLIEICEINPQTMLNKKIDKVKYVEMAAIDENLKTIKYYLDRPINKISSGAPRFTNNDIIFARITPCTENGKIAFVDNCKDICAGSTELHVLRPKKDKILPHFLFYFIITPKIRNMAVASMIGSTGRQRVPAEFFHYLKIPLPPIETQQKIVEKLSAIQEYKKKLLEQKQKLQELFESVLNKSFKCELAE